MKHYFSRDIKEIKNLKLIETIIRGFKLKFYTASNVFSRDRIDQGTKLLAETMLILDGWKVLDLGCGYGVLGIVAAKLNPHGEIYFSDINPIAVELTEINCKINEINNYKVILSDLFEKINENFNTIITNPPYTAGEDTVRRFIRESYDYLVENGVFQIVIPRKFEKRYLKFGEKIYRKIWLIGKNKNYVTYIFQK